MDSVNVKLTVRVKKVVAKYLSQKKNNCSQSLQQCISMVLEYLRPELEKYEDMKGRISYDEAWKQYPLEYSTADRKKHQVTIAEIMTAQEVRYTRDITPIDANFLKFTINNQEITLSKKSAYYTDRVFDFVVTKLSQSFLCVYYEKDNYILSNTPREEYVAEDQDSQILLLYKYKKQHIFARDYFPCNNKYAALRINQDYSFYPYSAKVPAMVCPYKRIFGSGKYNDAIRLVYDVDDEVIDYVYNKRYDQSVTKEQIKAAYEQFAHDYEHSLGYVNSGK